MIRVLRVIEYTGPRAVVEAQVALSLHGTKHLSNGMTIRAATIGEYPEILDNGPVVDVHRFGNPESKPHKKEIEPEI